MSCQGSILVKAYRGATVESVHYGSIAVVDSEGHLLHKLGDPNFITYLRSSAKPFQVLPLIESGTAKRYGFTSAEIALVAGSHSGEDYHVATVKSILEKIGLSEKDLQCGIHVPHRFAAMKKEPQKDETFSVLEHNCSGKHAGMLALAAHMNLSTEDYLSSAHPVQKLITAAIAKVCQYPEDKIGIGVDGCSAPVHALPIYNMALGFARLVSPPTDIGETAKACRQVTDAVLKHPEMVGGTARFDTVVMQSPGQPLIAKAGAEGLECLAVQTGIGAAIKIHDGARRAIYPAATQLICCLGWREIEGEMQSFYRSKITNWRGMEVGFIESEFELEEK